MGAGCDTFLAAYVGPGHKRRTTLRSDAPVVSYTTLPKMAPVSVDDTLMLALHNRQSLAPAPQLRLQTTEGMTKLSVEGSLAHNHTVSLTWMPIPGGPAIL